MFVLMNREGLFYAGPVVPGEWSAFGKFARQLPADEAIAKSRNFTKRGVDCSVLLATLVESYVPEHIPSQDGYESFSR